MHYILLHAIAKSPEVRCQVISIYKRKVKPHVCPNVPQKHSSLSEARAYLLWQDSANHCTSVPPTI